MRTFLKSLAILIILTIEPASGQTHDLFTSILKKYTSAGMVDYKNLSEDKELDKYLDILRQTDISKLSQTESLAFWINAYNAFTLKIIAANYPIESINDLHTGGLIIGTILGATVWDDDFIDIGGNNYSLNDIEHKILRKKYDEPRIHFAIVCASISCPPLRNEAYEAKMISRQLEDQAVIFFNDVSKNSFDLKTKTAYLSKILDWFDEDFGDDEQTVLRYTAQFLPSKISNDVIKNIGEWEIEYKDYNWNLNEQTWSNK